MNELGLHAQSIQNRRYPASQQTLAAYAPPKGLGRIVENETLREKLQSLRVELAPSRGRPRLTKQEKAERRLAKAKAIAIAKTEAKLAELKGSALRSRARLPSRPRSRPSGQRPLRRPRRWPSLWHPRGSPRV